MCCSSGWRSISALCTWFRPNMPMDSISADSAAPHVLHSTGDKMKWIFFISITGCAATARTPIIVPPEAVREWAYNSDGETGEGRYVVRMTDGRREWEVEFPDARYGSEVRVPLKNGGHQIKLSNDRSNLTAADRELQEADRIVREKSADKP